MVKKKKIDHRIKPYANKKGETLYMFQVYCGINPLTGKKKRTTRRGFKTAFEADLELKRLEFDLANEIPIEKKKSVKFESVYELWFEDYKKTVRESTWTSTKQIFKTHILPSIGENFIDKMTVIDCQKAVNFWAETMPKGFKKQKNYAANVFDYAMSIQLIDSNPMRIIKVPKIEHTEEEKDKFEFYSKDELNEFLDEAKKGLLLQYVFFYLLAYTGLRKGEAFALTWSDINYSDNTLTINKTVTRGEKSRLIINKPKTKNSIRKILIDDKTISLLKKLKTETGKVVPLHSDNLIFNTDGKPYNPTISRFWLNTIYSRNENLKRISTHGFRHTHASLLFESGASIKDVQERLGHSNIQTTSNIYTHVTESQSKKVMNNFVSFMSE
ncbi:site-specific integrase [Enterococcus avium]|uniref:site-specific integrase n=1 Tax=Enterococcus avium TaxID=33945 RepID=UPI001F5AE0B3|nr:site-specific integrase [Enterococcus avium]